jgi:hypothetical protein
MDPAAPRSAARERPSVRRAPRGPTPKRCRACSAGARASRSSITGGTLRVVEERGDLAHARGDHPFIAERRGRAHTGPERARPGGRRGHPRAQALARAQGLAEGGGVTRGDRDVEAALEHRGDLEVVERGVAQRLGDALGSLRGVGVDLGERAREGRAQPGRRGGPGAAEPLAARAQVLHAVARAGVAAERVEGGGDHTRPGGVVVGGAREVEPEQRAVRGCEGVEGDGGGERSRGEGRAHAVHPGGDDGAGVGVEGAARGQRRVVERGPQRGERVEAPLVAPRGVGEGAAHEAREVLRGAQAVGVHRAEQALAGAGELHAVAAGRCAARAGHTTRASATRARRRP